MRHKNFSVYNSFTQKHFCGNPAGVVNHADDLSTEQMQAIARQLNLVETVFILKAENPQNFCKLRYFMPEKELPVAGHPTLAAWSFLRDQGLLPKDISCFTQETGDGVISIRLDDDKIFCSQKKPSFHNVETQFLQRICATFHVQCDDVDASYPFTMVDAGLGHLIFAVKNLDVLMSLRFVPEDLKQLCDTLGVREAQVFTHETIEKGYTAHTRNLCPRYGLEDPACGNGNAALAAYMSLHTHDTKEQRMAYCFEQGYIVERPAHIYAQVTKIDDDLYDVMIGGHAVPMINGQIAV